MAYITAEYYKDTFGGVEIADDELTRLVQAASDAIDMAAVLPIEVVTENVMRATAYEVECLFQYGGIDAIHGFSSVGTGAGGNERLGDYSVSAGATSSAGGSSAFTAINGIPISPFAIELLRKDGLMRRWFYQGRYDNA